MPGQPGEIVPGERQALSLAARLLYARGSPTTKTRHARCVFPEDALRGSDAETESNSELRPTATPQLCANCAVSRVSCRYVRYPNRAVSLL